MALTRFVGDNVNGFPARLRRRPAARRWMARGPVALLLLLALALALGVLPAQAETVALVSNLDQPHGDDNIGSVGGFLQGGSTVTYRTAQRFSTGGNPHGYTLSDVRAYIFNRGSGDAVSVSIHSAGSSGNPGSSLYELENPDSIANNSLNTFTADDGAILERETDYFVVFEGPSGNYSVEVIQDNDEDTGAADGWSITNGRRRQIGDNSWGQLGHSVRIEINGTVNDVKLVGNMVAGSSSGVNWAGIRQGEAHLVAQRFSTGGNGAGYALTSVAAVLGSLSNSEVPRVSIYSSDSSGNPGSSLYVLANPETFLRAPHSDTFTAPAGATLERETDYHVVFEGTAGNYTVHLNEDFIEDADGAEGWSIRDIRDISYGSVDWGISGQGPTVRLQIRGIFLPNTPAGGRAGISGSKTVGQVLTADTSGITDANGLDNAAFSYQWVRVDGNNERDIPGATGSSYTLVEADYDKKIRVRVSFVDDAGYDESVTSDATGKVQRGPELLRVEYRPTRVELWYDAEPALAESPSPPPNAFSISINGAGGVQPSSVVVSSEVVLLTLPTPVESGDRVSVSYTVPDSNPIRDNQGKPAPGFTARSAADVTGTWYGVVRVEMTAGSYQSTEPRTGQAEVTVGVYPRSPVDILPPDLEFWVEIETSDGTATAGADYVPLKAHRLRLMGTHTQENPATATILVNADDVMDGRSETLGVGLNGKFDRGSAPAARLDLNPSRVTISDDDEASLELVASPNRIVEGRTQEIELEVRATDDDGSSSDECRIAIPLSNISIRFGGSAERGADKDYTLSTVEGDLDDIDLPPCGTAKVTVLVETKSDGSSEFEESIQPRLVLPLALDDRVLRGLLRADEITIADPYSNQTCEHEQVAYCGELTVGKITSGGLGYASFDNLQGGALSPNSFPYEGTEYRVLELGVGDSQYGSISLLLDPSGGNVFKERYKLHLGDHVVRFAEGEYWEASQRFTWRLQGMRFSEGDRVPVYISRIGPDVTSPRLINAYVTTGGDRVILEFSEKLNVQDFVLLQRALHLCVLNSHFGCPQDVQSLAAIDDIIDASSLISASDLIGSLSSPCAEGEHPCLTSGYGSDEQRVLRLVLNRQHPIHASDHLKLSFDRSDIAPEELTDAAGNHLRSFRFRTVTNHSTRSVPGCQEDDIWCAIMTVGQSGQALGFSQQSGVGDLWDRGFIYEATRYAMQAIVVNSSRLLTLEVNPATSAGSVFHRSKFDLYPGGPQAQLRRCNIPVERIPVERRRPHLVRRRRSRGPADRVRGQGPGRPARHGAADRIAAQRAGAP